MSEISDTKEESISKEESLRGFKLLIACLTMRVVRFLLYRNNGVCSEKLKDFIEKREDALYKSLLFSSYIKKILPRVYSKHCNKSIQNKVIFMTPHPGSGLNESFKLIYNKLKKEHNYDVHIHALQYGSVPVSVYFHNAEKFIIEMSVAKAVFVHMTNNLMGYINIRKETKVIQLWHACGSFKKLGLSIEKNRKGYDEYPPYNKYTTVTISSPEISWMYEEFMGIDKNSGIIKPIGVSRTDVFFDKAYIAKCYKTLYKVIPAAVNKKVILYAPTYRGGSLTKRKAPNALNVRLFAKELRKDYILIIKHHQTVKKTPKIPEKWLNNFAFDMTRSKKMSISDLLTVSDICISDYSSLTTEFSLFERPMLFFTFDLEDYVDKRGLYYDFEEITPGPLCRTNEELIDNIKNIDSRFDKQRVIDFKNRFMGSCDGHSTDRIIALIEE